MKSNINVDFKMLIESGVKRIKHDGKDYLVAPVVLLTEGIRNGTLYTNDDLEASVKFWNGVPVTIVHPATVRVNGEVASAGTPEAQVNHWVGNVFNVSFDEKLKGELWIDINKADKLDDRVIKILESELGMLEVSTGLFTTPIKTPGVWNNEQYVDIAHDHRPDHLALLPDEEGACSIADGCGAPRLNADGSGVQGAKAGSRLLQFLKSFKGKKLSDIFKSNETSHEEIREMMRAILQDEYTDTDAYAYIVDVYDDYFIYEVNKDGETPKLYKQEYTFAEDAGVVVSGGKIEMELEYVVAESNFNDNSSTDNINNNNNNEGGCMKKLTKEKRNEMVVAIIDSDKVPAFCANTKGALEQMPDENLTLIYNDATKEPETDDGKDDSDSGSDKGKGDSVSDDETTAGGESGNTDDGNNKNNSKPVTLEQIESLLGDKVPELVIQTMKAERQSDQAGEIITGLLAADGCDFDKEELEKMSVSTLTKLARIHTPLLTTNFGARAGEPMDNISDDEVPKSQPVLTAPVKK